jgi:hypothetical protein
MGNQRRQSRVNKESGEQVGLGLWPREHDLPPRWDGLPVEWGDWADTDGVFICPPPRRPDRCGSCGCTLPRLISLGRIWTDPATAPPGIGHARMQRGRHLVGIITAFRCVECRHDSVLDNEQWWDLDVTDYTDDGSWDIAAHGRP